MYANYERGLNGGRDIFLRRQQKSETVTPSINDDIPSVSAISNGQQCSRSHVKYQINGNCRMQSRFSTSDKLKGNVLNEHVVKTCNRQDEGHFGYEKSGRHNGGSDIPISPSFSLHANRLVEDSFNYLDAELRHFDEREKELGQQQECSSNIFSATPSESAYRALYQTHDNAQRSHGLLSPHSHLSPASIPSQTANDRFSPRNYASREPPDQMAVFSVASEAPFELFRHTSPFLHNQPTDEEDRSQRSSQFHSSGFTATPSPFETSRPNVTPVFNPANNQSQSTNNVRHTRVPRNVVPPVEVIEMNSLMESDKVHAFESTGCEESESKADGRSASEKRDVYLPGLSRPLKDGERLVFDKSAYEMYHKFHTTYPCLSFEPLTINESSEIHALEFPFQCSLVAGTQAMKSRKNAIIVMRLKNLNRFSKRDVDESSSSEEDEESIENNSEVQEPCFNCVEIPHHGDINRIRTTYVHKTLLCATWNAIGKVHIWNLSPAVRAMEAMDGNGEVVTMKEKNVFTFAGHLAEGFAMDWSSLTPGRLATGDCRRNIHLWKLVEGGTWQVDQRAFKKHEDSVEDIRWSKSEQSVFFSCSSDRSIKIWDARAKPDNACMFDLQNAHDSDVNVIDVSNTQQLLISGGDDGAVKIWDLRTIKEANPVAVFKYHQGPINSVEWCPHERGVFAASSEDDVVTLWDLTADAINFTEHENLKNVPPQLLFIHLGQREVKEVHWHPSCEGVLFSTAINGFNIAKTISV